MRSAPRTSLDITNDARIKTVVPRDPRKTLTKKKAATILERAGLKGFRPLGYRILVVVASTPDRTTGGIWYPTASSSGGHLYDDRLGSKVSIVGEIIDAGPLAHERACRKAPFVLGERIFFSRMNFVWLGRIGEGKEKGDYVGLIDPIFCDATVVFED